MPSSVRLSHSRLAVVIAACVLPLPLAAQQTALQPPVAERRTHVDTLHGEVRSDDYFWLREKSDPAVAAYLEAENAYAEQVLAPLAGLRETLYQEMLGRIKQTDLSVPYRDNGYFYYSRTEEGKQYPVIARKRGSLDAPEEVLLDVNRLAEGQSFMSVGYVEPSPDAQLLAYGTDSTGYRQYVLHVKDLRTGQLLDTRAERLRSVAWADDNRTLFYTVEHPVTKRAYQIYRHVLGTPTHELLYEEPDERFNLYVGRTSSDEYLLLHISSLTTSEVRYLRADDPAGEWRQVAPRVQDREYDVGHHGDSFYIRVNDTGRNFRLVKAPVTDPAERNWTEVIPHRDDVMLQGVQLFRNHMLAYERADALPRLVIHDLRNGGSHEVAFPEPVYSVFPTSNAEFDTNILRYAYQSFVTPSSVYDYDMDTRQATLLKQQEVLGGYDPTQYESERVWAVARDGTRVPVSLVYRKGTPRDGSAPMLLGGYGSYGASSNVSFSSNRLSLLDRGLIVGTAHIRGGGDLGQAWHDQGRMQHKINTFTDFIDVAEHLVKEGYTSSDRLVIEGGSAGGLLMGAVTNMRPDLFRAVIAHVPFVDVINTMLDETLPLTVGEFEEWGNPKIAEQYRWIRAYDPYTNVAARDYPAMLVKTSFNDSQVMYHEPAKWVAKLRAHKTDDNPLLFVTNMAAGHGGSSGRYDRLREIALDYAFMLWQVGAAGVRPEVTSPE
ncbi:MAG: S9 family peptidase [Candidatus Cloacimonetes bacterium]|jgi:oligopeptidase B|nr:S9 family peptidase [Candidatus Cloacimonadota bacterium]